MVLSIGVDFDGVIADPVPLKIRLAKELFGINLKPENVSRKRIINSGIEEKVYDETFRQIMLSPRRYEIKPVQYAKEIMRKMYDSGLFCSYIITSRNDKEIPHIKDWLEHQKIRYHHLLNTSDKPKNKVCLENKILAYLDDDLHKLEEITNGYTERFLLKRPYNEDLKIKNSKIKVSEDWLMFYQQIKCLQLSKLRSC
jgi:hypothetical protein